MPSISLTDTSSQLAEIERRRKMAEMLQQQAQQPTEIQSYKGIQAPIPWTATLAKVLGSYAAAKQGRDAIKEEGAVRQRARNEAGRFIKELEVDPGMSLNAGLARPDEISTAGPGVLDRLKGILPGQQPQQPPMPPQGPSAPPQAYGAALAGAPQPQAVPPPAQQAPMPAQAMGAALAGQQPPQAVSPVAAPEVAPVQPFDPRRARPMEEQQQRLLEASMSGNPYLEKIAPAMYDRNQGLADEDRKFGRQVSLEEAKAQRALHDKLLYDQLKPEDRTALQKDYDVAKGQGYDGSFMDFAAYMQPKFVSTQPGQPMFNARDLASGGGGHGAPAAAPEQVLAAITQNFPGARITSGPRTPEQNAAVNGVPNSAHLTGHAVDFVLGSQEEMQAAADKINAQGLPGVKALYEGPGAHNSTGPHVHVQVSGGGGGGAQPVAVGPQRPQNSLSGQLGQWGLSPEESAAINKAAGENRLDAARLNSRTAKIQAGILLANPGIDLMNNHAMATLTANAPAQQKAMLAAALPEVLENVRDAGKKLNFNDVQFVGKLQAWTKGQLNDPDLAAYMTQRNDAMQTLAQVMSGVGATDMRTKMESEAAPKSMSPRAWDAWYQGQLNALRPRIEAYEKRKLLPQGTTASVAPKAAQPYSDPAKEARYQAWLKAHGGR
jgi:hypothetical protein